MRSISYRSSNAVEYGPYCIVKLYLLVLVFELNVNETQLAPLSTTDERATVFRINFLHVENAFVHGKH